MMSAHLLVFAALLSHAWAEDYCQQNCNFLCQQHKESELNAICNGACTKACYGAQKSSPYGEPYFRARTLFTLPVGEWITGGDSPVKPANADFYFTTLTGKLYHYVTTTDALDVIYSVDATKLASENGKGLYGVTLDRDYNLNQKLYLHYSVWPESGEQTDYYITEDAAAPDVVKVLKIDHFNVIQELEHTTYNEPVAGPVLRRIPQFSKSRSGGWIQAFVPEGFAASGNRVLFALGGNAGEDFLLARHAPYLSTIHATVPSQPELKDKIWASGLRDPISCTATSARISEVYCLLQTITDTGRINGTAVFRLKPGNNYGSEAFHAACTGLVCEQQYNRALMKSALLLFPDTGCSVRSIFTYTGSKMPRFRSKIFLVQDSCFQPESMKFSEVQILYLSYSGKTDQYTATPLYSMLEQRYLIDVKLLGGDNQNTVFLSGVSIKTGETVVQEIIPDKAGKIIDLSV